MISKQALCAITVVAIFSAGADAGLEVEPVVNVQLNLRYTDPADEAAGGTWQLLAGSTGGGIAGLVSLLDNINNDAASAGSSGFEVFESQQVGSVVEIVIGSDLQPPLETDIGTGPGTTGNVEDDLFPGNSPVIWANNALLASGTFGGSRPLFIVNSGTLSAGVNVFAEPLVAQGILGTLSVRGDGVATDGLLPGDADRDGDVDVDDFNLVAFSFDNLETGWDQGNFDSTNGTDVDDFNLLAFNFDKSIAPPAISAIPEPTTLALISLTVISIAGVRRRS